MGTRDLSAVERPKDQGPTPAADDGEVLSPILAALWQVHDRFRHDDDGRIATYIPVRANADPRRFGIALATADGYVYEVGDSDHAFTIQSISKPFVYGLALEDHGPAAVLKKVGVEPSGDAFNSIIFDERSNRPFNPMINAGAIATTALVKGVGYEERLARLLAVLERFAGRPLEIDEAVYQSERASGHRNRAIAYLALNAGMVDEPIDEHLDLYFAQCSVLVSARDIAVMAATLANGGVNPLTGQRAQACRPGADADRSRRCVRHTGTQPRKRPRTMWESRPASLRPDGSSDRPPSSPQRKACPC